MPKKKERERESVCVLEMFNIEIEYVFDAEKKMLNLNKKERQMWEQLNMKGSIWLFCWNDSFRIKWKQTLSAMSVSIIPSGMQSIRAKVNWKICIVSKEKKNEQISECGCASTIWFEIEMGTTAVYW